MHLGLSRALKNVHWTVFVRRYVPPAYDLRLPHRPAPLGRGLSSATAAPALALCFRRRRRLPPQQAILVPNGAQTAVPSKTSNKKSPAARPRLRGTNRWIRGTTHIPYGLCRMTLYAPSCAFPNGESRQSLLLFQPASRRGWPSVSCRPASIVPGSLYCGFAATMFSSMNFLFGCALIVGRRMLDASNATIRTHRRRSFPSMDENARPAALRKAVRPPIPLFPTPFTPTAYNPIAHSQAKGPT